MSELKKLKVGVVGCGCISEIYLKNLTTVFENIEVVACCDLIRERAENRAKQFNVPKVWDVEQFYNDPEIELVVNLTNPTSHSEVDMLALTHGKHFYSEKPFGVRKSDAKQVVAKIEETGLLAGGAPETFLGGGLQTVRKLIDEGAIGKPLSAVGFMMGHGPESWHPDPAFFYQFGGGPCFDMGPYYLTAMVSMLGPVKKVAGATSIGFPERTITCKQHYGEKVTVEIPTYIAGTLTFQSGVIGTLITSFDTWRSTLPRIEIHGTDGSLLVPDPNTFGGTIKLFKPGFENWQEIPICFDYTENSRGIGVSDMARYLTCGGTAHRANYRMAYHVLDIMESLHESSKTDRILTLDSTMERPAPLTMGKKIWEA